MKKYVTLLTAMFCLMFAFGLNTKAATYGDLTYTVRNGSVVITDCNDEATNVKIPSTIAGKKVTAIGELAFARSSIKSVTIPNSMKTIGTYAFSCCTNLKSVTIPNSVKTIGFAAFTGCESLKSVTIPNSVKTIGNAAFDGCKSLKSITIPNSVKTIGNAAFERCESLKSVTIPKSVKHIGGWVFKDCTSLKSVTILSSVKAIDDFTFYRCNSLKNVTIPSSVKTIGECAFSGCNSLKSITIPKGVRIRHTVLGCGIGVGIYKKIKDNRSISYVKKKISGFTIKGYDEPYREIDFTAEQYAILNGFKFISLTKRVSSVIISGSTHEVIEGNTLQLKATVSPSNAENKKVTWVSSDNSIATVNQNGLVSVNIGSGGRGVIIYAKANDRSGKSAFWIIKSKAVAKIGSSHIAGNNQYVVTSANTAAYTAPALKSITAFAIPETIVINNKVFTVTEIYPKAFAGCKNLKTVSIPATIQKIGAGAFYKCKKLKKVYVKTSLLTKATVGAAAFKKIYKKAKFYVPSANKKYYKKLFRKRGAPSKIKVKGF